MAPKIYGSLASVINWLPVAIDAPSQASKLEINLNANDSKMCVLVIESLGLFIKTSDSTETLVYQGRKGS